MSLSNFLEDKLVDSAVNGTPYTGPTTVYAKAHIGDPGEAGTSNAAAHTTRASFTFGASSGGVATSDSDMAWTSWASGETVTHLSFWDASTAGNCLGSGALTASKVMQTGDNLTVPTGSQTFAID